MICPTPFKGEGAAARAERVTANGDERILK